MDEDNNSKGRNCFEKNIDTKRNITQTGLTAQKIRQTKTKTGGKKKKERKKIFKRHIKNIYISKYGQKESNSSMDKSV